jgi:hypothetical protein
LKKREYAWLKFGPCIKKRWMIAKNWRREQDDRDGAAGRQRDDDEERLALEWRTLPSPKSKN